MTTEMSPAERFNANIGFVAPAPQAPVDPAGAPAPAGQAFVASPWGTMHSDPQQALAALSANHEFQTALMDGNHPGHKLAVAQRSEIFQAIYGAERGDALQGNGSGNMSPDIHEGHVEPTEAEMQAAYTATAAGIFERYGADPETAQDIAKIAIGAGLSTLDVSEVAQAIDGSREYASPEAAIASLGPNSAELIRAAQLEANALKLPQELLNMPVGIDGALVLGEHPALIKALAARRGIR